MRLSVVSGSRFRSSRSCTRPKYVHAAECGVGGESGGRADGVSGRSLDASQVERRRRLPAASRAMAHAAARAGGGWSRGRRGRYRHRAVNAVADPPHRLQPPTARDAGELFEYSFSSPGHGEKRRIRHAAVPAAENRRAQTAHLLRRASALNPQNAAEITNSTGKTLDGGPITVYDAGTYAGEALVETVKAGDKRLISYGVDLGTRITTKFDSSQDVVREIHLQPRHAHLAIRCRRRPRPTPSRTSTPKPRR